MTERKEIKISVVIPVYNRKRDLDIALASLTNQTNKAFEVIVVDDGSSEDLTPVIEKYSGRLVLSFIRIENSGGPARPRNGGVSSARGEWISFLDSDDGWHPQRIERVVERLTDTVDIVYHALSVKREDDADAKHPSARQQRVGRGMVGDSLADMLLRGNPIPNSAALIRRSFINRLGGISEEKYLRTVEDFDLWLRAAEAGARFNYIDMDLGWYSIGSGNISSGARNQIEVRSELFKRHEQAVPAHLRGSAIHHHNYILGVFALRAGDYAAAASYLRAALPLSSVTLTVKCLARLVFAKYKQWRSA